MKYSSAFYLLLGVIGLTFSSCATSNLPGIYNSYSPGLSQEYGAYQFFSNGSFKHRWISDDQIETTYGEGTYEISKGDIHLTFKRPLQEKISNLSAPKDSSYITIFLDYLFRDAHHIGTQNSYNSSPYEVTVIAFNENPSETIYEIKKMTLGDQWKVPIHASHPPTTINIQTNSLSGIISYVGKPPTEIHISQENNILYLNNRSEKTLDIRKFGRRLWLNDRKFIKSRDTNSKMLEW